MGKETATTTTMTRAASRERSAYIRTRLARSGNAATRRNVYARDEFMQQVYARSYHSNAGSGVVLFKLEFSIFAYQCFTQSVLRVAFSHCTMKHIALFG